MAPRHPIAKAADIDAALRPKTHWLNASAMRRSACVSDMVGMGNAVGVHVVSVAPNTETTEMHHHLTAAEWLYILRGTATLRLTPMAYTDSGAPSAGLQPVLPHPHGVEEHAVGAGDFIGFPGGGGEQFAHTMVAGRDGAEYLVGGTRPELDVCMYPFKGQTLLIAGSGARAAIPASEVVDPAALLKAPAA